MDGAALQGMWGSWGGGKQLKGLERRLVLPVLLLESGGKVGPSTYLPKLMAQKHQLMYSLAVGLCCAESKRSCCAVRLLVSQPSCMCARAHKHPHAVEILAKEVDPMRER